MSDHMKGRILFDGAESFSKLCERFDSGAEVKSVSLTEEFDSRAFQARYGGGSIRLFAVSPRGELVPVTADRPPAAQAGWTLIILTDPAVREKQVS